MNFCPNCGAPLEADRFASGAETACDKCHAIYYRQLKVGVGAIIERGEAILLLRRSQEPFKDCWNLPAGYVNYGESPIDAVIREVAEECGLLVGSVRLLDVHYFADDPRGCGILITYRCDQVQGQPMRTSEASEVGFFPRDSLPSPIAGAGHNVALKAWRELRR